MSHRLLPILFLLRTVDACVRSAVFHGLPDSSTELSSVTLASPSASACGCCGLCHQHSTCASLAFNTLTSECKLFSAVANYTTITPAADWEHFITTGRSQHGQFCREDSDCQQAPDSCRGRVCTTLDLITCRTIYDVFLRESQNFAGGAHQVYGWLDNEEIPLVCLLDRESPGFTLVFRNILGFQFTRDNLMDYNRMMAEDELAFSQLQLAERLRQDSTEDTYQLQMYSTVGGVKEEVFFFTIPRDLEVTGTQKRLISNLPEDTFESRGTPPATNTITLLQAPSTGSFLLTFNGLGSYAYASLAAEDGTIKWRNSNRDQVLIFIRTQQ